MYLYKSTKVTSYTFRKYVGLYTLVLTYLTYLYLLSQLTSHNNRMHRSLCNLERLKTTDIFFFENWRKAVLEFPALFSLKHPDTVY